MSSTTPIINIECSRGCKIASIRTTFVSGSTIDTNTTITNNNHKNLSESDIAEKLFNTNNHQNNSFKPTTLLSQFPDATSLCQARGEFIFNILSRYNNNNKNNNKNKSKSSPPSSFLSVALRGGANSEDLVTSFSNEITSASSNNNAEHIITICWILMYLIRVKKTIHDETLTLNLLKIASDKLSEISQQLHQSTTPMNDDGDEECFSKLNVKFVREIEIVSSTTTSSRSQLKSSPAVTTTTTTNTNSGEWWCKLTFPKSIGNNNNNSSVTVLSTSSNIEHIISATSKTQQNGENQGEKEQGEEEEEVMLFRGSTMDINLHQDKRSPSATITLEIVRKDVRWRTKGKHLLELELHQVLSFLVNDLCALCAKRTLESSSSQSATTSSATSRFLQLFFSSDAVQQSLLSKLVSSTNNSNNNNDYHHQTQKEPSSPTSPQYPLLARRAPLIAKFASVLVNTNHINFGFSSNTITQFCLDRYEKIMTTINSNNTNTTNDDGNEGGGIFLKNVEDSMMRKISILENYLPATTRTPIIPLELLQGTSSTTNQSRSKLRTIMEDLVQIFLISSAEEMKNITNNNNTFESVVRQYVQDLQRRYDRVLQVMNAIWKCLEQQHQQQQLKQSSSSSSTNLCVSLVNSALQFLERNKTFLFAFYNDVDDDHEQNTKNKYLHLSALFINVINFLTNNIIAPTTTSRTFLLSKSLASTLSRLIFKAAYLLRTANHSTCCSLVSSLLSSSSSSSSSAPSPTTTTTISTLATNLTTSLINIGLCRAKTKILREPHLSNLQHQQLANQCSVDESSSSSSSAICISSSSATSTTTTTGAAATAGDDSSSSALPAGLASALAMMRRARLTSHVSNAFKMTIESAVDVNNAASGSSYAGGKWRLLTSGPLCTTYQDPSTKQNKLSHYLAEMKFVIPQILLLSSNHPSAVISSSSTSSSYYSYYTSAYSSSSSYSSPSSTATNTTTIRKMTKKISICICTTQDVENPSRVADEAHSLFLHLDSATGITAVKGNEKLGYVDRKLIVKNMFQLTPDGMNLTDDVEFKLKIVPSSPSLKNSSEETKTQGDSKNDDDDQEGTKNQQNNESSVNHHQQEQFFTIIPVLFGMELTNWTQNGEDSANNNNNNLFTFPASVFPQLRVLIRHQQSSASTSSQPQSLLLPHARVRAECQFLTISKQETDDHDDDNNIFPSAISAPSGMTTEKCFAAIMTSLPFITSSRNNNNTNTPLAPIFAQQKTLFRSCAEQHLVSCLSSSSSSSSSLITLDVVSRLGGYLRHQGAALTRSIVLNMLNNNNKNSPIRWPSSALSNLMMNIDLVEEVSAENLLQQICDWFYNNNNNSYNDSSSTSPILEPIKWVNWKTAIASMPSPTTTSSSPAAKSPSTSAATAASGEHKHKTQQSSSYTLSENQGNTVAELNEEVPSRAGDFVAVPSEKLLTSTDTMKYAVDFVITASTSSSSSSSTSSSSSFGSLPYQQIFVGFSALSPNAVPINVTSLRESAQVTNPDGSNRPAALVPLYCLPNDPQMLDGAAIPGLDTTSIRRTYRHNWASAEAVFVAGDIVTLTVDLWRRNISAFRNGLPLGVIFNNIGSVLSTASAAAPGAPAVASSTPPSATGINGLLLCPFFRVNAASTPPIPTQYSALHSGAPFFPALRCRAWYRPYTGDHAPIAFSPIFSAFIAFLMMRCNFSEKSLNLVMNNTNTKNNTNNINNTSTKPTLLWHVSTSLGTLNSSIMTHLQRQNSSPPSPSSPSFLTPYQHQTTLLISLLKKSLTTAHHHLFSSNVSLFPELHKFFSTVAKQFNQHFLQSSFSSSSSTATATSGSEKIITPTTSPTLVLKKKCSTTRNLVSSLHLLSILKFLRVFNTNNKNDESFFINTNINNNYNNNNNSSSSYFVLPLEFLTTILASTSSSIGTQGNNIASDEFNAIGPWVLQIVGNYSAQEQITKMMNNNNESILQRLPYERFIIAGNKIASSSTTQKMTSISSNNLDDHHENSAASDDAAAKKNSPLLDQLIHQHHAASSSSSTSNGIIILPHQIMNDESKPAIFKARLNKSNTNTSLALINHDGLISGEGIDGAFYFGQKFKISGRFIDALNIRLLLSYDFDDSKDENSNNNDKTSAELAAAAAAEEEEDVVDDGSYACAACTYINPATAPRCEICGTPRAGATRVCGVCTYAYNAATDTRCNMCGSALGGGGGGAGRHHLDQFGGGGDDGQGGGEDDDNNNNETSEIKLKCKKCKSDKIKIESIGRGRGAAGGRGAGRGGGGGRGGVVAAADAPLSNFDPTSSPSVKLTCKDCQNEDKNEFSFTQPVFAEMRLRFCYPSSSQNNNHNTNSSSATTTVFSQLRGTIRLPNSLIEHVELNLEQQEQEKQSETNNNNNLLQISSLAIASNMEIAERQRLVRYGVQAHSRPTAAPALIRCLAGMIVESICGQSGAEISSTVTTTASSTNNNNNNQLQSSSPSRNNNNNNNARSASADIMGGITLSPSQDVSNSSSYLKFFASRFTAQELVKLVLCLAHATSSWSNNYERNNSSSAQQQQESSSNNNNNFIIEQLAPFLPEDAIVTLMRVCFSQLFSSSLPNHSIIHHNNNVGAATSTSTSNTNTNTNNSTPTSTMMMSISMIHSILVSFSTCYSSDKFLDLLRKSIQTTNTNTATTAPSIITTTSSFAAELYLFALLRHLYCTMVAVPSTWKKKNPAANFLFLSSWIQQNNPNAITSVSPSPNNNSYLRQNADPNNRTDEAAEIMGLFADTLFGTPGAEQQQQGEGTENTNNSNNNQQQQDDENDSAYDDTDDDDDDDYDQNEDMYMDEGEDGDQIPDGPLDIGGDADDNNNRNTSSLSAADTNSPICTMFGLLSSNDIILYCEIAIALVDSVLSSSSSNNSINASILSILATDKRVPEGIKTALLIRAAASDISSSSTSSSSLIVRPDSRVAAGCYLHRICRSIMSKSNTNNNKNDTNTNNNFFPHELLAPTASTLRQQQLLPLVHNAAAFTPVASSLMASTYINSASSSIAYFDPNQPAAAGAPAAGTTNPRIATPPSNINGLVYGMLQGATYKEAAIHQNQNTNRQENPFPSKLYYEVVLPASHRYAQLRAGFGTAALGKQGVGSQVGSTMNSVAYNLKALVHAMGGDAEYDPPRHTHVGDIVGCLLDTTTQCVTWSLNGMELTPMSYGAIDGVSSSLLNVNNSSSTSGNYGKHKKNTNNNSKKNGNDNDDDENHEDEEDEEDNDNDDSSSNHNVGNFLIPYVSGSSASNDPLEVRLTDCMYCPVSKGYREYSNILLSWNSYVAVLRNNNNNTNTSTTSSNSSPQQQQQEYLDFETYLALNVTASSLLADGAKFTDLLLPLGKKPFYFSKKFLELERQFCNAATTNPVLNKKWPDEIQKTQTLLRVVQPYLRHLHSISDLSSICGGLLNTSSSTVTNNNNNNNPSNSSSSATSWMRSIRYLTLPTHRWGNFERLAAARLRRGTVATGPDGEPQLPKAHIDINAAEEYYKQQYKISNINNTSSNSEDSNKKPKPSTSPTSSSKNSVFEQLMQQVLRVIGERCMHTPVPYTLKWKDCIAEDRGGLLRATYSAIADELMGRRSVKHAEDIRRQQDDDKKKNMAQQENNNNDDDESAVVIPTPPPIVVAANDDDEDDENNNNEQQQEQQDEIVNEGDQQQDDNNRNDNNDEQQDEEDEAPPSSIFDAPVPTTSTTSKKQDDDSSASIRYPPFCRLFVPSNHRNISSIVPAPITSSSPSSENAGAATATGTSPTTTTPAAALSSYDQECYRFLGMLLGNITLTGTGVLSGLLLPRMFWMYLLGDAQERQAITLQHYFYDVNDSMKAILDDDEQLLDDEMYNLCFPGAAKKFLSSSSSLSFHQNNNSHQNRKMNQDEEDDEEDEEDENNNNNNIQRQRSSNNNEATMMTSHNSNHHNSGMMMMTRSNDSTGSFDSSSAVGSPITQDNNNATSAFPRVDTGAMSLDAMMNNNNNNNNNNNETKINRMQLIASRRRQAAEYYLLHQFDVQFEAIRQGFATIVPGEVSRELTWQDLERRCCGVPASDVKPGDTVKWFDLSVLQQHRAALPSSSNHSGSHHLVHFFEEALRGLSGEQRAQLLVFCTGQTSLPLPEKILVNVGTDRNFLPSAHTCSPISLMLQPYESTEELREKLLLAIFHYSDFSFV